jgi:HdeA/HdeB family
MKPFYATILAAALLLTASPLLAEDSKIDMKKLSCKQFSGYDKDNMSIIMMWLEGYYTGDEEDPVIDFGKMAGDTAHLLVLATIRTTTSSPLLRTCSARTEG